MSRRFLSSGLYSRVISADLSEAMLLETRARCLREGLRPELVRCDAAKLPFLSGSLDAVHAGAAMHCWPRVSQVLGEVHRSLRPGGAFFATTILTSAIGNTANTFIRDQYNSGFSYFKSTEELFDLTKAAGFDDVAVRQEGRACAVIRARKPL